MYDYGYGYDYTTSYYDDAVASSVAKGLGIFGIIMFIFGVFLIIGMWKLYKKAGKPGWASIVPVYNIIVLIEIAGLPMWYLALFLVPLVNIYAMFKIYIEIAHKFGKSTGFGVGMFFFSPIFIPILAFSSANYGGGTTGSFDNNNLTQEGQNQDTSNYNFDPQTGTPLNQNPAINFNDPNSGAKILNSDGNSFTPVGDLNNNINVNPGMVNPIPDNSVNPGMVNPVPDNSVNPSMVNPIPDNSVNPGMVNPVPDNNVNPGMVNPVPDNSVNPGMVNPVPDNSVNPGMVNPVPDNSVNPGMVNPVPDNSVNPGMVNSVPDINNNNI